MDDNCKVIVAIDEDGRNVIKKCTLPERMRYVFDDWGIDYTHDDLEDYIGRTKLVQADPNSKRSDNKSVAKAAEKPVEEHKGNIHEFEEAMERLAEIEENLDDIDDIDSEF